VEAGRDSDRDKRISRRDLLFAGAAAGLTLAAPVNHAALARSRRAPLARDAVFGQGVSSGFPGTSAATLWTRVSDLERRSRLTLEVARDRGFRNLVRVKEVIADPRNDFTIHQRIGGLEPGQQYFYRFESRNSQSRVGRFRTMPPANSKEPIRVGFFSCQNYTQGFYTPHAALAAEPDLDLVVCLGDYIYEYGSDKALPGRTDRTGAVGNGDVQTLDDYRQKYRLYQSDRNLQAMHAAHPFIAVWDDHEVEDNYTGSGNSPNQPDPSKDNNDTPRRVPFGDRRTNGYRAFFEAMPRLQPKKDRYGIYGSLRLGGMAELFLTDQRRWRDPMPCDDQILNPCSEYDQERSMLGSGQKEWIKRALPASNARWKLWGSQVMMMGLELPRGAPLNPDQWDGYKVERAEILGHFRDNGVNNLVVLTGDIHTFFAGNLTTTGNTDGDPVGVELVGGSITSTGIPEALGLPGSRLEELVAPNSPHISFANFDRRGYGVVTLKRDEIIAELKTVESTLRPKSSARTLARFRAERGRPELIRA
jgi:alkaline phosphatase D